jgi:hypothetical protein
VVEDTKEVADSIIHFVGYIVTILNSSKSAFTVESFFERISDEHFVSSQRYAELIAVEIPAMRKGEVCAALYRRRKDFDLRKLRFIIAALLNGLTPNQLASYLTAVSDDLKTIAKDAEIRTALQMLKPSMWGSLHELPKLRIENKLIASIKDGAVTDGGETAGALGTWSNSFVEHFALRNDAAQAILGLLWRQPENSHYAAKYFMAHLPKIATSPQQVSEFVAAISICIQADEGHVRTALIERVGSFPEDWQKQLAEALKEQTDPENPAVLLSDGSPFLSSPPNEAWDDDIPV